MSAVVKLSENTEENTRMLNKLMNEKRYYELNGLKVEPRFAEKPLYTVRDLWFQVTDKKFLDSLEEKPKASKKQPSNPLFLQIETITFIA